MPRHARFSSLPFDMKNMSEADLRKLLDRIIKASQENFDSLSGDAKGIVDEFNRLAGDVDAIAEHVGLENGVDGEVIEITGGAAVTSHDELEDVSPNDHHNQAHDQGDHNAAESGDLSSIDIGDAAAAGSSVEVPNADHQHAYPAPSSSYPVAVAATAADGSASTPARSDHRHAHGTGYTGAHSDAVNDGDAAGGVLGGTYPNPSFAADMATQAELDAHTGDTTDAHDASAVSIVDAGNYFTGTEVEAALQELGAGGGGGSDGSDHDILDHADANTSPSPTNGDVLTWDSTPGEWIAAAAAGGAHDHDTNALIPDSVDVQLGPFKISGSINASLSADVDDWAPTGYAAASVIRVTPNADWQIKGIQGGVAGKILYIVNLGADRVTLKVNAGTSTAAYRISGASDMTMQEGEMMALWYDGTSTRWRPLWDSTDAITFLGHLTDTTDAHDASAISVLDTANYFTGTDVEAVLAEIGGVATATRYFYLSPDEVSYDDATLGNTGTSPDLVSQTVHTEVGNRTGFFGSYVVPGDWKAGTAITCAIYWYTSTSSGDVRWLLSESELAVGDSPAEVSSLAAAGTTVADSTTVKLTTLDTTFTPSAAGALVKVNVERNAGTGVDTATGAARVLMVRFAYTANGVGPAGPTGALTVQEEDATVDSAVATLDFGPGFDVTSSPATEANITLDDTEIPITDAASIITATTLSAALQELAQEVSASGTGFGSYINHKFAGDRAFQEEDFLTGQAAALNGIAITNTGTSAVMGSANTIHEAEHPGIYRGATGTTSVGKAGVTTESDAPKNIILGTGELRLVCWLRTETNLSDSTNRYTIRFGLTDTGSLTAAAARNVEFSYIDSVDSGKWQCQLNGANSTSSVTVLASTWYKLEIRITAAAGVNSITFYINDVLVSTQSSPSSGTSNPYGYECGIIKSAGTTSRFFYLDYIAYMQTLLR
ncbi:MAG: hypothetical protein V4510_12925 [bacterium]